MEKTLDNATAREIYLTFCENVDYAFGKQQFKNLIRGVVEYFRDACCDFPLDSLAWVLRNSDYWNNSQDIKEFYEDEDYNEDHQTIFYEDSETMMYLRH